MRFFLGPSVFSGVSGFSSSQPLKTIEGWRAVKVFLDVRLNPWKMGYPLFVRGCSLIYLLHLAVHLNKQTNKQTPTYWSMRGGWFTPYVLGECHESGEGASINADRYSEKLGLNVDRRPQAGGLHWAPISKNEVCIYGCARARLMVFALLLGKLKPTIYFQF